MSEEELFDDGTGHCRVCGMVLYTGGGESYDADGRLAEIIQPDYEKQCDCTVEELEMVTGESYEDI